MPLAPGTRLGPYEVTAQIGVGGMGEVYQATDTKLKRQVAIKVLPESVAADKDRLARFQREAEVLASLNHPHIAAIYGLEDADGGKALVMELVGPTLADRIARGAIPVDEAIAIAKQIAEALEAAHEQGIIHRDLKPANVKVREDGTVKVLDFGLAKALEPVSASSPDISHSPTLTSPALSQVGMILGTAAYMSPEQAKGRAVDKRTDIFSFGIVLFEMLTGKRPHGGETVAETLASVIKDEPSFDGLPPETPAAVRNLLRRCLQKDLRQRLQHIGEARIAIEHPNTGPGEPILDTRGGSRERVLSALAAIAFVMAALGWVAFAFFRSSPAPPLPARFVIDPPDGWTLALGGHAAQGGRNPIAVSPNGRQVAFVAADARGRNTLWVRPLDALNAEPLSGTEDAWMPFWSPDSRSLAFFAGGKLKRIDVPDGPATTICDVPAGALGGGLWRADGSIVFNMSGRAGAAVVAAETLAVSASGGRPSTSATSMSYRVSLLPDGEHFFEAVFAPGEAVATAVVRSFESADRKLVIEQVDTAPILYSQGHVLFLRDSALLAQPFDLQRLETIGDAVVVAADVSHSTLTPGTGIVSVSENGVLVYRTNPPPADSRLAWFDRSGRQIGVLAEDGAYAGIELAPDGTRAAVSVIDRTTGAPALWLYDLSRAGVRTRLTTESGDLPVWSPDSSRIAFFAPRQLGESQLVERGTSGSGAEQVLVEGPDGDRPSSWSPDGRFILFTKSSSFRSATAITGDLWALPLTGDREPSPILQSSANERNARFSPDGRWIAFQSDESGRSEVYVMPFPDPGPKRQVSTGGGLEPRWRCDGREIFYLAPDSRLMAATVTVDGGSFEVGAIQALFDVRPGGDTRSFYDVSPDGQRFLVNTTDQEPTPAPITVVVNWSAAVTR